MKPSKLEAYYVQTFHEPLPREDDPPRSRPARPARVREGRERGGFWRFFGRVRLVLMLGPLAFFGLASVFTDCSGGARSGWMPAFLRTAACARHDVVGNLGGFQRTMQTVSGTLR